METPRAEHTRPGDTLDEKIVVADMSDEEVDAEFDEIIARIDADQSPTVP